MVMLRRAWTAWKELAGYIGEFQARLLLTVFYFTVAVPFGVLARVVDPLRLRTRGQRSAWVLRPPREENLSAARRQF